MKKAINLVSWFVLKLIHVCQRCKGYVRFFVPIPAQLSQVNLLMMRENQIALLERQDSNLSLAVCDRARYFSVLEAPNNDKSANPNF